MVLLSLLHGDHVQQVQAAAAVDNKRITLSLHCQSMFASACGRWDKSSLHISKTKESPRLETHDLNSFMMCGRPTEES